MADTAQVTVEDNAERRRYEAVGEDGTVLGFAEYRDVDGVRVFTHTEVDDAVEGQGVGSTLARGALDDTRGSGRRMRIKCPFIKAYVDRHPEYADLLA